MKKQEILSILKENKITSSNLKTFLGKNKKNKALGCASKLSQWLIDSEKETEAAALKAENVKRAKKWGLSLKKYLELVQTSKYFLAHFDTNHSMGCYRNLWIGTEIFASNDKLETYSKGCKFKPTYGNVDINLSSIAELKTLTVVDFTWQTKFKKIWQTGTKASHEIVLTKINK
jgi:hypothetical protein